MIRQSHVVISAFKVAEEHMFRGFTGVIVSAVLIASGRAPLSAQGANSPGEKVFTDQKCGLCHSVAGKGNPKGPLDDVGSKLSPDDIRAWIVDAKGMTAKTKATR